MIQSNNLTIEAAIYCRVSSDEASQSLNEQVHICRSHILASAKAKGVEAIIRYTLVEEVGTSGKDANRPEYQKLLRLIRTRAINCLASKELARLSRNVADFQFLMEECRKHNVTILIPGMNVDLDSATGEVLPLVLSVISQFERKQISFRVRSSLVSRARRALMHGQPTILGFRRSTTDSGKWEVIDEKMQAVIAIFRIFDKYKSYKITLQHLLRLGIKTQTGRDFDLTSLKRILINRKYIGKLRIPGEDTEVDLPFGAVVPLELFDSVQRTIQSITNELKGRTRNPQRIYLLSGLLLSSTGNYFKGLSARGRAGKRYFYYRCYEDDLTFSSEEIEAAIIRSVEYFCMKEGVAEYRSSIDEVNSQQKAILARNIAAASKEIERLASLKAKSLDGIINSLDASSILVHEVEQRILSINDQILSETKKRNYLSLQLEGLVAVDVGVQSLEKLVKAREGLLRDYSDREVVRGWFRDLFHKVVIDVEKRKISIFWSHETTGGRTLLPFTVDIPIGSRKQAIYSVLGIEGKQIIESKLYGLATKDKMTSSEIGRELGVSRSTVSKYLKKLSIPTLRKGQNKKRVRGLRYGIKSVRSDRGIKVMAEQRTISAIKTWRIQGKTFREIAEILNVQGTPTKTGRGKWHGKTIQQVMVQK